MKNTFIGLVFAALWASASVATKFGLQSAQPLMIANARFFIAGVLMLFGAYAVRRYRLPRKREWRALAIYGFFNVTLYLGAFVFAMSHVSAGIGSLATAISPLFISILSAVWLKKRIKSQTWLGLCLGICGVGVATYPLLVTSHADAIGLLIMLVSMLSYAIGTVYYSSQTWTLPRLAINGWQVLLGGAMLLPLTLLDFDIHQNTFDVRYWLSVAWLVLPVSIGAVQLWLYLLKEDAVKAAMWIFLCPIFGFLFAYLLLHEPITSYTFFGTALVIAGLYLGQRKKN